MTKKETSTRKESTQGTTKFNKYERARIIGSRALQIAQGAPLLIPLNEKDLETLHYDPVSIAKKEFEAGLVPMDVERHLPPKTKEEEIRVVVDELSAEESS